MNVSGQIKLQELTIIAEQDIPIVRSSTGIAVYYHAAEQLYQQGIIALKSGDLEKSYVYLLRFSTFVLNHIPTHSSYNHSSNAENKATYRAKCVKVMKDLESIKQQLDAKYGVSHSLPSFSSSNNLSNPQTSQSQGKIQKPQNLNSHPNSNPSPFPYPNPNSNPYPYPYPNPNPNQTPYPNPNPNQTPYPNQLNVGNLPQYTGYPQTQYPNYPPPPYASKHNSNPALYLSKPSAPPHDEK